MGKPRKRERQSLAKPSDENGLLCPPEDEPVEDGWLMVKKQKVTILIPPLQIAAQFSLPEPSGNQLQTTCINTTNNQSQCSDKSCPSMSSASGGENSISSKSVIPCVEREHPRTPVVTLSEKAKVIPRTRPKNSQDYIADSCKRLVVHSISRVSQQSINILDGKVLLQRWMRASSLERKLEKAGGLSRWLTSLGLDQFIKIFQGRSVNKFQLVNLTMRKLKEMGADPVGPRRKLMHAINCLDQSCCFHDFLVPINRMKRLDE